MATVVLAPNAFKGSIGAADTARALAVGWRRARPADGLVLLPMADGGDGTLDALEAAMPAADRRTRAVPGPLGGAVSAPWLLLPDRRAVVELAGAGGLAIAARSVADPRVRAAHASTAGFGALTRAALDAQPLGVLLSVGGSASTDGGAGFLQALGARLLDAGGRPVPPGNAGLAVLHAVDLADLVPPPAGGARLLADVDNPLLGPNGAVSVFAPQKGAAPADLPGFERNLERLAALLAGRADPASPGAGAAGGTGFAALIWGAHIVDGAREVADRIGLPAALAEADAVVSGEGRFDAQTAGGKVPEAVRRLAAGRGVDALLVAGGIAAPPDGWAASVALDVLAGGLAPALADPARWLTLAGERLAAGWRPRC